MQPLVHLFGLIILTLIFLTPGSAETWDDNLYIELPIGHDIMIADWNELQCLAVNIYHEARGETELGQELVAQVTVNRMHSPYYPDTACGVVRQSYQFSWTHDGRPDTVRDRDAYELAFKIAIKFLHLAHQTEVNESERFTNYHADYVAPDWYDLEVIHVEGRHMFYRPGQ